MSKHANHRILIIDDNRGIHEDFQKILCPGGETIHAVEAEFFGHPAPVQLHPDFELHSAYQGSEGLEAARKAQDEGRPFAMAFLDVRMPPGMDGIQTAEMLWKICPDLQIVVCTAYSDYSWEEMVLRLKKRDQLIVLKKPFSSTEAVQIACALCEKWRLTHEAQDRLALIERDVEERTRELRETNRCLAEEIEQRKKAESQLLRAQRLESIGVLAGGIAHDLNNMLSPILMCAGLLRNELPEKSQSLVSTIESCADRAAGVVKQVLTFARGIEGQRIAIQPRQIVHEMEKMIVETFPRQIILERRIKNDLPLIEGDPTQLQQILLNLSVNARDAMPDGGTLGIELDESEVDAQYASSMPGARPGRYVRLRVSDTGCGIAHHLLEKIFDPFFTTKPLGKGTGLGLSTVIGIVKSHGGFLDVHSSIGKGTTFDIFLPAAPDCIPMTPPKEATPPPDGHGELILVVDDEASIRNVTQTMLTQHGYRTLGAADGAEALTIFARQNEPIAAVFTDIMMPVVDGVALSRALKKMDPGVRIITASGSEEHDRRRELNALNIENVLSKPFTTRTLLTALGDTLTPCLDDSGHAVRMAG